ncbi:hypothetical protein [Acidicapsa ligni]|uniref:hypothetical protein n=1 Tax=Acidicapsa ligni TaxID=542300 RepID=UPI0021E053B0|nr:hypothetical protein [Acidicapsa ligni]
MQRLYSMFPAGTAGIALFILRLAFAATLLESGWEYPDFATASTFIVLVLPVSALCLGIRTPYASIVSCLIELALIVMAGTRPELLIVLSIASTAVLGILGPGAYSLDSHIFGRRIIRFPVQGKPKYPNDEDRLGSSTKSYSSV